MNRNKIIKEITELSFTRVQIYILSFLVPMATMVAVMIGFGVQPFGNNTFMIIDGLHQYMPFFTVLYDKLKAGEGLFYTFRSGLGINFLSLFSYYLSSPMNLLLLLFKKTHLNMAVSLIMALKIALSGLTAAIYFGEKTKKPSLFLLVISMTYSLNSYMVGYSWNIMWLDAIMIFPIVLLGIERLIEKGDGRLYAIALFYALYCNYYIAFMICIFAVLWFLIYQFTSLKQFIRSGFAFAGYSLLSAGMASILLIPAYIGIKQTASGEDMSLPGHNFLTTFTDIFSRHFALCQPISHDNFDGNGNFYFGMFAMLAIFLFLFNMQIKLRKKITIVGLYVLLLVSCNEEVLNFIWHGFHNQYGIPNRFSFMMGFLLIYMLFESVQNAESIEIWQPALGAIVLLGLLWICKNNAGDPIGDDEFIASGMLLLVYAMILTAHSYKKFRFARKGLMIAFAVIAVGEMCVTAILGFDHVGQVVVDKYFTGIEDMDTATSELDNGDFFRSELDVAKIVDESTLYPMNSVGLFGSTARHDMVKIMDSLGFYTGCNEYLYKGDSPLTNFLLAVKYHYSRQFDNKISEFKHKATYGDFDVYENPIETLSIGYPMDITVDDWFYQSAYPFRVLNDLCQTAWRSEPIFQTIYIDDPETKGVSVERTNDGEYHFDLEKAQDDNLRFCVPIQQTQDQLFLHYDGSQVEEVTISIDNEMILAGDEDSRIICLGKVEEGSKLWVSMKLKGEKMDGVVRLSVSGLYKGRFDQLIKKVSSRRFRLTKHSAGHIEGTIDSDKEQYLFFSIPYDQGWRATIDGKSAETHRIGNAFLSVIIEEGQHEIILDYVSPGFSLGWKVSLASVLLFVAINIYYIRKKKAWKYAVREVENDDDYDENEEMVDTGSDDVGSGDSDL